MDPDWARAAALIAAEEAFVDYPYDDCDPHYPHPRWTGGALIGTATIGYGETDSDVVGGYVARGDCMTEDEASALLGRRLPPYWEAAKAHFTVDLNPNQAAAVLSMAYNAGPAGMRTYAPDLLAAINQGRFTDAVELWKTSIIRANGVVLAGLQRRRAHEASLFATPYPTDPPAPEPQPEPQPEPEPKGRFDPGPALATAAKAAVAGVKRAIRATKVGDEIAEGPGKAIGDPPPGG